MNGGQDGQTRAIAWYVGVVALVGAGLLTAAGLTADLHLGRNAWVELVLFAVMVYLCEARPITVARDGGVDQLVTSSTFTFALFLSVGALPAIVAQVLASLIVDVTEQKSAMRMVFNASQYMVCWGAATFTYAAVVGGFDPWQADAALTPRSVLAIAVAGATFFLVNSVLVGAVVALSRGTSVVQGIASLIPREAASDLILLALAPIVVVVSDRSLLLLPLLLLPVIAIYRSAAIAAEKEHLAIHDSLTDLQNRLGFLSELETRIARRRAAGERAAVLLIDLDHFKEVNDTLGHQAGDELLQQIGPRLIAALPAGSVVARLGGDEFAVLLHDIRDEGDALDLAASLCETLDEPFRLGEFNLEVEASVGVSMFPEHGTTTDLLLKHADIAMYVAKRCNSRVELYDPEQDHHSTRRLNLMGQLRSALADGHVVLYYQPKLDLRRGGVHEVEALVRWVHPDLGMIPPAEFVPMAEHTGLIRPLTSHVLSLAAAQVLAWRAAGIELAVSVNLSARSLHDGAIADEVEALLAERALPAGSLRLEITESSIMADPTRAKRVLERLDAAGIHLAIDDFGTGYSSLAYLQELPVSEIKIDRSFVMNMMESDADQVIVRSTIELARNLGLTSTAEGVETERALRWLVDAGCDHAQGYHIARPMPSDAVAGWLAEHVPVVRAGETGSVVRMFPPRGVRRAGNH